MEDDEFDDLASPDTEFDDLAADAPSAVPKGMVTTGARVLELPETTVEGAADGTGSVSMAPGAGTEYNEVREAAPYELPTEPQGPAAPDTRSRSERLMEYLRGSDPEALGSGAQLMNPLSMLGLGDDDVPSWGGRELPSLPSIRRAASAGGDLDVLMPAAATDDGQPIVGRDERPNAAAIGATDGGSFGFVDELAGAVGGDERQAQERARSAQAQEQSGAEYGVGYAGGVAPAALIPGAAPSAAARIGLAGATGAGLGLLRGVGESTQDGFDRLEDGVRQGGIEGALSAGTAGLAEGAAPLFRHLAARANNAPALQQARVQAGLEARGIWGRRSQDAVRARPGGAAGMIDELDALGAPLDPRQMVGSGGSPGFIDRMLDEGGQAVGSTVDQLDGVGATVPGPAVGQRLRALAASQDASVAPLSGSDATQRALVGRAERIEAVGDLPFSTAHNERRAIDRNISWRNADANISSLDGQGQGMRRALSTEMQGAADAAGLGPQWTQGNRRYAVGSELDEVARGAERLNAQGGMAGAGSRWHGVSQVFDPASSLSQRGMGVVEAIAGPAGHQELRMRLPGMQYRAITRVLRSGPQFERAARVMQGASQRGGAAVAAAHALLMRSSPDYRRAIQAAENEAPEGAEATP